MWVLAVLAVGIAPWVMGQAGLGAEVLGEAENQSVVLKLLGSNAVLTLFAIIGLGLLFGQIRVAGMSLGSSGVLFAALLAGHLGLTVSKDVGIIGLVLFVYGVGLAAGPSFFRAFVRQGKTLAQLALVLVGTGVITTVAFAVLAGIPQDLAVGIFAGSLTSTPALATAVERLGEDSGVSIGYGVAYPFGVIGVVLIVQLLPRLIGKPVETLADDAGAQDASRQIVRRLVEITNPACFGKQRSEINFSRENPVAITRVLVGERLMPITADYVLRESDCVWVVGQEHAVQTMTQLLGHETDRDYVLDSERERQTVVVTASAVVGKTIGDIKPLRNYSVTVSRVTRQDIDFAPDNHTQLRPGDVLTAVGDQVHLKAFAQAMGHRAKAMDETDLISLAIGLVLGVLVGQLSISLGGGAISLGLAGGPLLVALVLGHFGRVGRVIGFIPRASRMVLTDIGLVFFLAWAGANAGASFVEVVTQQGPVLLVMGACVTLIPMMAGFLFARYVLKLNILQTLGGMCGGMTSTPGLGAITAKTDAESPVISYAAAYPVALILMTVAAKAIIGLVAAT